MSMYRGHLVGGFVAYIMSTAAMSLVHSMFLPSLAGLIAALAGSLFPDIDIQSKGQRLFLKLLFLLILGCFLFRASIPLITLLLFSVLPIILPHRGLFHDAFFVLVLTCLAMAFVLYILPDRVDKVVPVMVFFYVGVISHLVLDKGFRKTFYQ